MGQWGQLGWYDGITVIPHVHTGNNPFNPIKKNSFIDSILVLDSQSGNIPENYETRMQTKFIGMLYTEYLRTISPVCPTCKQEIHKK